MWRAESIDCDQTVLRRHLIVLNSNELPIKSFTSTVLSTSVGPLVIPIARCSLEEDDSPLAGNLLVIAVLLRFCCRWMRCN